MPTSRQRRQDVETVLRAAAGFYDVTPDVLAGRSQRQPLAEWRAIAMYAARGWTAASYDEIGERFGGRDHSTVMSACRHVLSRIRTDRDYAAEVADVEWLAQQSLAHGRD